MLAMQTGRDRALEAREAEIKRLREMNEYLLRRLAFRHWPETMLGRLRRMLHLWIVCLTSLPSRWHRAIDIEDQHLGPLVVCSCGKNFA